MSSRTFLRLLLVALAAGAGFALARMLGAPAEPAAVTAAIAAAAAWFAQRDAAEAAPPAIPPATSSGPPLEAVLAAVDDPVLLVVDQIVAMANPAARAAMGAHIVGEDVRIAIRHPAATDRLTRAGAGEEGGPVTLIGVGERQRRWVMEVHRIAGSGLLVRLVDKTDAHVAEQMRVDFVANASHELRTPLATLLGFIETLGDDKAGEDAATRARFLKIMFGEAKRMQRLVEDLISLSRIEAEKFTPPQSPVPVEPVLHEVRDAILNGLGEDRQRVQLEVAADLPAIAADKAQISQLLHNIIGNALKYGRPDRPVKVTAAPARDNMIRIAVRDEGEGIPPEHIPRLTERFYRVDPGRSRAIGGTGLGLAIVKHIVERHRGRLEIRSEVGRGTVVSVLLPAVSSNCHVDVTGDSPKRSTALGNPA